MIRLYQKIYSSWASDRDTPRLLMPRSVSIDSFGDEWVTRCRNKRLHKCQRVKLQRGQTPC